MDYRDLLLEEQVAQLFMVGYEGAAPGAVTQRFLECGVGGLIFFRDNFSVPFPQTAGAVHEMLAELADAIPEHLPPPLMGIDQEGGQVERLPHAFFPTALTPRAVALSSEPETLAHDMYGMMAAHLVQLGFNLDFFPTLDVNLNRLNPIIGVRSFGDDPETVWKFGSIAMSEFQKVGLIAVGKHFPGHGNGTVDSHLDLPTLHFTDDELLPFRQAIDAGLPVMLVAHGFYPELQTTDHEKSLPSSASPAIIQDLLRARCGFKGVVITDDMCMGAITKRRNPVEAALASLRAGVDILLYRRSTEEEWGVYEAVLDAFREGKLPLNILHDALGRIRILKRQLRLTGQRPVFQDSEFRPLTCWEKSDRLARRGVAYLSGKIAILPLPRNQSLLLVYPDRRDMGNYAFDVTTSTELDGLFWQAGYRNLESLRYPASGFHIEDLLDPITGERIVGIPDTICMVTFNPRLRAGQADLYDELKARFPQARMIVVSAGTPYDADVLPDFDLHLGLCAYRPASMRALAHMLAGGLGAD